MRFTGSRKMSGRLVGMFIQITRPVSAVISVLMFAHLDILKWVSEAKWRDDYSHYMFTVYDWHIADRVRDVG